jgi:hypothetical protein
VQQIFPQVIDLAVTALQNQHGMGREMAKLKDVCDPLPAWDWVWVTLGSRLGHPRATQAWRKGGPRVDWRKSLCLQQELKKWGWGLAVRG